MNESFPVIIASLRDFQLEQDRPTDRASYRGAMAYLKTASFPILTQLGRLLAETDVMTNEFRPQQNVESDAAKDEKTKREHEEDERVPPRILQRPFGKDAIDGDDQTRRRLTRHHRLSVSGRVWSVVCR